MTCEKSVKGNKIISMNFWLCTGVKCWFLKPSKVLSHNIRTNANPQPKYCWVIVYKVFVEKSLISHQSHQILWKITRVKHLNKDVNCKGLTFEGCNSPRLVLHFWGHRIWSWLCKWTTCGLIGALSLFEPMTTCNELLGILGWSPYIFDFT